MNPSDPLDERRRKVNAALEFVLATAVIAAVFAYVPATPAEPELFFLPKELLASICAVGAAALLLSMACRFDLIDAAAAGVLIIGVVGALVTAADVASAWRAIGLSAAATTLFWAARGVGPGRVVPTILLVVALVAGVALLQAYRAFPDFSLTNRRPGATLGNRNELARLLVLAVPLAWRQAMLAVRRQSASLAIGAIFLFGIVIALSRSRTAWIGVAVLVGAAAVLVLRRATSSRVRTITVACIGAIGLGGAVAIMVPSSLNWVSRSPFRDTARSAVSLDSGSGRGRVIQFRTTLVMASRYPILGVGPGNWVVHYPRFAPPGDPSYHPATPFPVDRLPQSDVSGLVAERGLVAGILAAFLVILLMREINRPKLTASDLADGKRVDDLADRRALSATLVALLLMAMADPVFQLPASAVLGAVIIGFLAPRDTPRTHGEVRDSRSRAVLLSTRGVISIAAAVMMTGLFFTVRRLNSTLTLQSATLLSTFELAVSEDPSNYEARIAAARWLGRAGYCDRAEFHLGQAAHLRPAVQPERFIASRCRKH